MNLEDDVLSNLTTASSSSAAATTDKANFNGGATPPPKKKKGRPCNPDPDAEVIAMSPRSLQATNRFICEVCNKGFQRDQNLQLHRRGHNLPWQLKQRHRPEHVRRKVYVCPEPTCAHHDPSRALGDLTGIKKHFSRKHGEKRWKCERCEKKYAVRSDWKAHSKVCGMREYKCDCGTVFSRRDSFITHRAFCDVVTRETTMKSILSLQLPPPPFASLTNTMFTPPAAHPPVDLFFNHSNGFPPAPPLPPVVKMETELGHLPAAAFSQQQQALCFPTNPNPGISSSATEPSALVGQTYESFMLPETGMSMTAMMMMNSIAASEAGAVYDDEVGGLVEGILNPGGREGDQQVGGSNLEPTRDFLSLSREDDDISCMQQVDKEGDVHHHRRNQA
ncbi:hypothetical protein MLD38_014195 [Melastoma candidum]|uniref:Uncharacterized protein n=1 Tax=Melastoma candidum TaxID=119954 RepID=A0ACB9RKE8_9MYRT|nr:hypothetical protein MLD38_014195 [Melastoma candidum]